MAFMRRKRCILVSGLLLWLLALITLKVRSFAPKDANLHGSSLRLRHNAIALAVTKSDTPTEKIEVRIPIKIDSEFAHAQEKLRSKLLEEKHIEESRKVSEKKRELNASSRAKEKQHKKIVEVAVEPTDSLHRNSHAESIKRATHVDSVRKPQQNRLERRFPHILIIGMGKAGTRAVYDMIRIHPDVNGPQPELRYFDRHFDHGIQWYMRMMPQTYSWQKTIEKSPDYIISLRTPPRLLDAMKKFNRTRMKLVLVLRDPFTRAVSEYIEWKIQRTRVGAAMPLFHKMALDKNGNIDIKCPPVNTSAYSYHLEHWLKYFSREDFCFVSGEKIVTNPYPEMKRLEKCLGLRSFLSSDNFVYNPSRGFYCLKKAGRVQCMDRSKGRRHPDVEKSVEEKLRAFYMPFNRKLYELTGRDFGWT